MTTQKSDDTQIKNLLRTALIDEERHTFGAWLYQGTPDGRTELDLARKASNKVRILQQLLGALAPERD
jgi:hypothetical protein